jgi:hypothetical protein
MKGCRRIATDRLGGPEFERLMGAIGGADRITLNLGREIIELVQFDLPGEPYPHASSSSDLVFQHFAIVVADMMRAVQRLSTIAGWTPISTGDPQHLPASSGGLIAFKFRDPEGHPLELLAFPGDVRSNWPGVPLLPRQRDVVTVARMFAAFPKRFENTCSNRPVSTFSWTG